MNTIIQSAIQSSLTVFAKENKVDTSVVYEDLIKVFSSDATFLQKVDQLDAIFDDQTALEPLREVYFDLLLMNFFSADALKLEEDYLESAEWEQIEEDTIDRGTELLNVLLYLNECKDEGIEPELEDFLKEFLLVDEDEFQDEHRIYEDIIANQVLMETSVEEIAKTAASVDEESDLKELFYPVMCFFYDVEVSPDTEKRVSDNAPQRDFDMAVYTILKTFNQS
jgi:hypothetical protein